MAQYTFLRAYVKTMRPYYSFVTGISGWLGVVFYEHLALNSLTGFEIAPSGETKIVILVLLFLSWGVNQIFNDYLGLPEDRINAPHRPMVTGALNPRYALLLSILLNIVAIFVILFFLEPIALLPFMLGAGLNIVYQYAKGFGIAGNISFGLMITMAPLFGFLASGPVSIDAFGAEWLAVLSYVCLSSALLTFYTYFKDYEGDQAAGQNTLVVKYGIDKARVMALVFGFLPTIFAAMVYFLGIVQTHLNQILIFLFILTAIIQIWNGFIYYRNPVGEITYQALEVNFRAYCCGFTMIMALYQPDLAIMLFLVTYIFIGFLFSFHKDARG